MQVASVHVEEHFCEGAARFQCFPAGAWALALLVWSVLQDGAAWAVVEAWGGRLVGLCRCLALTAAREARSVPLQREQAGGLSPKNTPLK